MANESGVLVFGEAAEGGGLAAISLELLGAARRLGEQLGQPVSAAILGQGVEAVAGARDGRVVTPRPCYGGNPNADYTCKAMPQMPTVRGKSQEPLPPDPSRKGEVVKVAAGVDASGVR